MSLPKVTYFNIEGLGEPIRLLLRINGIQFEDIRVSGEEWEALRPTTPNGQLPLYEENGRVMAQCGAIMRYLGNKHGNYPKDAQTQYAIDEIIELVNDIGNLVG